MAENRFFKIGVPRSTRETGLVKITRRRIFSRPGPLDYRMRRLVGVLAVGLRE